MKKSILFIILLIIISIPLKAQKSKDALYLKNGSIIFGKLIEISGNQYKIRTNDGSLMIYPGEDVEKYTEESSSYKGRRQKGFGFAMEAGFLVGAQNSDYVAPFSFNLLANYTIDTKNIISAGSGVEFIGVPFSPIFIEYKFLIYDKKTSPFVFARGGKLLHLGSEEETDNNDDIYAKKNYEGGLSFAIGTGVSWSREDIEPYISFAYRYAATSYIQMDYNNNDVKYNNSYNRLEVKFGLKF